MKAEDTVIKTNIYNCHDLVDERVRDQAEISFKAGWDACIQYLKDTKPEEVEEAVNQIKEKSRQEGRREIVEWIEQHRRGAILYSDDWQAFKKERGLEEKGG